jgi:hypothetical protein
MYDHALALICVKLSPVDEKNIERPSKIAKISTNLCSFVWFLGRHSILPKYEVELLHEFCRDIGFDMIRSARAERVGEAYSSYVRGAYTEHGTVESAENVSMFKGGFEVAHVGVRFCLLRDFDRSGKADEKSLLFFERHIDLIRILDLDHTAFRKVDPVKVRMPRPLTKQLKIGDHLYLEIRRMTNKLFWVPTEC